MNLKQLTNKLLNKWPYKLLCLGLAIVVYIIHSSMEFDTKNFSIPLNVIEEGAVVDIAPATYKVQVRVRSDAETIASIHENDFTASVNLNNISESGEYQFPIYLAVNKDFSDKDVFEIKQKPKSIKLKVEKKDVSYIKLEPSFVGEPAHGYEVAEFSIEPEYVEVVGPESILKNTKSIKTEKIDLTNVKNDFTIETKYKNPNSVLQVSEKGPFTVKITMTTSKMDRTFENIPLNFRGLKSSLILIGDYPGITFTLNGSINSLETYELLTSAVYLDLSNITEEGTYEVPVQFTIPSYFTVKEKGVESVTVTVEKVPETPITVTENDSNPVQAESGE